MADSEDRFGGNAWYAGPHLLTDPGDAAAIPVTHGNAMCELESAGVETRTIAAPTRAGQQLHVTMKVYVGAVTITIASTYDTANQNTLVSSAVGESFLLIAVAVGAAYEWRIYNNNDGWVESTV